MCGFRMGPRSTLVLSLKPLPQNLRTKREEGCAPGSSRCGVRSPARGVSRGRWKVNDAKKPIRAEPPEANQTGNGLTSPLSSQARRSSPPRRRSTPSAQRRRPHGASSRLDSGMKPRRVHRECYAPAPDHARSSPRTEHGNGTRNKIMPHLREARLENRECGFLGVVEIGEIPLLGRAPVSLRTPRATGCRPRLTAGICFLTQASSRE